MRQLLRCVAKSSLVLRGLQKHFLATPYLRVFAQSKFQKHIKYPVGAVRVAGTFGIIAKIAIACIMHINSRVLY